MGGIHLLMSGGLGGGMDKIQLAADREGLVLHVYMRMIVNRLDGGLNMGWAVDFEYAGIHGHISFRSIFHF